MPKYKRPTSYMGRQANQSFTGSTRAATAAEAAAGTVDELYISPATLASAVGGLVPSATTLIEGVVFITDNSTPVATQTYVDNIAIAGAPAWSETVSGIGQLSTTAEAQTGTDDNTAMTPAKVVDLLETPPAIGGTTPAAGAFTTISSSGLASLNASATIVTGAVALNLGADAAGGAINLGTGAAARILTIGNVTAATQVVINAGTAGIQLASTGAGDITINSDDTLLLDSDGVLELNSSAGIISIGNDADAFGINVGTGAAARILTIGNNTGATQLVLESGSGGLDIATAGVAQSITIGNNTGATALVLEVGSGNFTLDGVAASTYTIGSATTGGTIDIGGTAQTGTITLGDSSGINIVQIGSGEGATTVNIAGGATAAKVVNIAIGAVANLVTIGSASGAASMDLLVGTGNFDLDGAATSDYTFCATTTSGTINFGGTGANTGTATIFGGSGAQQIDIADSTGGKTINLATGAGANIVAVGSDNGASSLDLLAGTGNFTLNGNAATTYTIGAATTGGTIDIGGTAQTGTMTLGDSSGVNIVQIGSGEGATTVAIAGGATAAKVVTIADGAVANLVTIGSVSGAASLDLLAGTGNFTLEGATATTYDFSGTGVNTGTMTYDGGTGARTLNFANNTGIKTINIAGDAATSANIVKIATGAADQTVTIGSSNTTSTTNILGGSGAINLTGDVNLASVATKISYNGGAVTDFIGTGTLVAGTVTIANTNIAAADRIMISRSVLNGSPALGHLIYTIAAGASFTVAAFTNAGAAANTDVSSFTYVITRQT